MDHCYGRLRERVLRYVTGLGCLDSGLCLTALGTVIVAEWQCASDCSRVTMSVCVICVAVSAPR